MENRQQQILAEIQAMMVAIRNELNLLDAKISEFQQLADMTGDELEPIDLDPIELLEPVVDFAAEPEEPAEGESVEDLQIEEEPVQEVTEVEEIVAEDLPEDDDLPFFEEESVVQPEQVREVEPVREAAAPIIDTMTDKQAWRTDMPGGAVKDVRSAISLNDRILFINKLFDEDPMAFQTAIGRINSLESLEQVIDYINEEHSDWNLESDTVYRFMMAVRRKVR
jgi:hypothetical protein